MKSASENFAEHASAHDLARILAACGFDVRLWRGQRIYLRGYGRDIRAYLEPAENMGAHPCDGARLDVSSSWQSARYNGLRCKGVKHAILSDLWTARLISEPPPARWQDVSLADRPGEQRRILPYDDVGACSA